MAPCYKLKEEFQGESSFSILPKRSIINAGKKIDKVIKEDYKAKMVCKRPEKWPLTGRYPDHENM